MYISLVNKFAEQAGIVPVALHTNPLVVSYHMNHETMVKFAELIVKECLTIIQYEANGYAEPVWAYEIVNDIKERFDMASHLE